MSSPQLLNIGSPSEASTTCLTPPPPPPRSGTAAAVNTISYESIGSCAVAEADLAFFKSNLRKNKICCIGAGYVGGPTMAIIASKCPEIEVYVVDISEERIAQWNSNKLPIYEPGLEEIVFAQRGVNLFFSTDVAGYIRDCDILFLCVNTPTKMFGTGCGKAADLSAWESASRSIAKHADSCKIVIEKSTVPVRTADSLQRVLHANAKSSNVKFSILSNPEFLAEGTAIPDLKCPDRVLIGGFEDTLVGEYAIEVLAEIYNRWVPRERILTTNVWSSEMSKLVANAMLAQRVSSINSVSMLCEKTGADVRQVAKAIGSDSRIGAKFLNASVGFGGSCFQKDILSLAYLCDFYGLHEAAQYWQMVKDMNDLQKGRFAHKIIHGLFDTVRRKKITILGFSFKKNTADTRASAAVDVCGALMADGAYLQVYDPQVEEESAKREIEDGYQRMKKEFNLETQFRMEKCARDAVRDSHAIVILTEWDEFTEYDYSDFFSIMAKPAFIFDGRNILDHSKLVNIGFEVHGVGVPTRFPKDNNRIFSRQRSANKQQQV